MKKNTIRGYIILAILFVVFTVIAFVIPCEKNTVFWLGYIFAVVAMAAQVYVLQITIAKGNDVKSRFYGAPIAHLGVIYLLSQLAVSLVEIILAGVLPYWIVVIINVVFLLIAAVGCITAEAMREEIVRQDEALKKDTTAMRNLQALAATVVRQCEDADTKKILQGLSDDFRYSDPVSSDKSSGMEAGLLAKMEQLQKAVIDGNNEYVKEIAKKIKVELAERNRVCSLSK